MKRDKRDESICIEFGDRCKSIREALGLTAREVAIRAGLTQAAISQIEHGKRFASLPSAVRISRALGAKLSKMLGER